LISIKTAHLRTLQTQQPIVGNRTKTSGYETAGAGTGKSTFITGDRPPGGEGWRGGLRLGRCPRTGRPTSKLWSQMGPAHIKASTKTGGGKSGGGSQGAGRKQDKKWIPWSNRQPSPGDGRKATKSPEKRIILCHQREKRQLPEPAGKKKAAAQRGILKKVGEWEETKAGRVKQGGKLKPKSTNVSSVGEGKTRKRTQGGRRTAEGAGSAVRGSGLGSKFLRTESTDP